MLNQFFSTVETLDQFIAATRLDSGDSIRIVQDVLHTSFNPPEVRQAAYEYLLAHYTKLTLRAREQYRVQQQERAAQADADARELHRRAARSKIALPSDATLQERRRAYFSIFGGPIYLDEYGTVVLEQHSNFDFEAKVLQPGETLKIAGAYSPPAKYRTEYQYARCSCGVEYVSFTQDEVKVWIGDHLAYVAERAYFDSLWDLEAEGPQISNGVADVEPAREPPRIHGVVGKDYARDEPVDIYVKGVTDPKHPHVAGQALAMGDAVVVGEDGKLYKASAASLTIPTTPATSGVAESMANMLANRW